MNRNQMYEYLNGLDMYRMAIRHGRTYHMEFRPNKDLNQTEFMVTTDWGHITKCDSIHLCKFGVLIQGNFGTGEIFIKYNKISMFEVAFEE